ncbi:YdhK family protein [Corynebacterium epidermidicanis]|uniref:Putative DUF1541 family protein n=1 Tax=Corynebacterium epidermidicanis TaxID=1050174 RepID=A0A0G3GT49_9CORY|nr:YdhK family protein [Corynebacterium epidermidicanis]AKK04299.1 putative DUF1541 family protein [Corynebacterium epidermidicanis]
MNRRARFASAVLVTVALGLTGCANTQKDSTTKVDTATKAPSVSHEGHNHGADGGAAPAGMTKAASPKFTTGQHVTLQADHMPGMQGADATIVAAYDTHTYSVTYTPTTGGAQVNDHKWVVQEELLNQSQPAKPGDQVTLNADHMTGMKGAVATVDSVVTEPVYMVDVTSGEMPMKNHKWVTESEIKAK